MKDYDNLYNLLSIENNKVVIKGKQIGTATLTITSKETHNYNIKAY